MTEKEMEQMQSNGCLMRAWPLALLEDSEEAIRQDVALTNDNRVCQECVRLYVQSLQHALSGMAPQEIYLRAVRSATEAVVLQTLESVPFEDVRDVKHCKGWVMHAFYSAYWVLVSGLSYAHAMDTVVLWGGDTDTNAAISGALYGAVVGYEKMLTHRRTRRNLRRMMKVGGERKAYLFRTLSQMVEKVVGEEEEESEE